MATVNQIVLNIDAKTGAVASAHVEVVAPGPKREVVSFQSDDAAVIELDADEVIAHLTAAAVARARFDP